MAERALLFRRRADADLDQLLAFGIHRFGAGIALAYARDLRAACERLCDFPEAAPIEPDIRRPTRRLHYRSYRILYRVEPDHVLIVRILHHARAVPTKL